MFGDGRQVSLGVRRAGVVRLHGRAGQQAREGIVHQVGRLGSIAQAPLQPVRQPAVVRAVMAFQLRGQQGCHGHDRYSTASATAASKAATPIMRARRMAWWGAYGSSQISSKPQPVRLPTQ